MFTVSKLSALSRTITARSFSQSYNVRNISLTLFTKDDCSLCTEAKSVIDKAIKDPSLNNQKIMLNLVDIMEDKNSNWYDAYCYDVPVLHIDKPNNEKPIKFMHRVDHDALLKVLGKED